MAAERGWQRKFEDPIPLPDERMLSTLRDAATFITSLPKTEALLPEWQAAIEALMLVAERDGPMMFARVGVMRALKARVAWPLPRIRSSKATRQQVSLPPGNIAGTALFGRRSSARRQRYRF